MNIFKIFSNLFLFAGYIGTLLRTKETKVILFILVKLK